MRGLKVPLGRVASSNDLKIDLWTDAAGNARYVRKAR
jgi:hypothetical protein